MSMLNSNDAAKREEGSFVCILCAIGRQTIGAEGVTQIAIDFLALTRRCSLSFLSLHHGYEQIIQ